MSMARSALCVSLASLSNPLEQPLELLVLVVPDLTKLRRIVPLPKKDHPVARQSHDLVGIDEVAGSNMLRVRVLALTMRRRHVVRIPLTDRTRNKLGRLDVVHTKDLQHTGIRKECVGAFAIEPRS